MPIVLMAKPEGKRLVERPKLRWEANIKMDLRKSGWVGSFWFRIWARILKK
jgi:hypothetical protein